MQVEDERRYVEYVSSRLAWMRKIAFLLCQDWDGRVVIHWQDDRGSVTYTVTDVTEDSAERFAFARADEPGRIWGAGPVLLGRPE